jgi:hypothetical protein
VVDEGSRSRDECSGLPSIGFHKRPGKYYVKLHVDKNAKTSMVSTKLGGKYAMAGPIVAMATMEVS